MPEQPPRIAAMRAARLRVARQSSGLDAMSVLFGDRPVEYRHDLSFDQRQELRTRLLLHFRLFV